MTLLIVLVVLLLLFGGGGWYTSRPLYAGPAVSGILWIVALIVLVILVASVLGGSLRL